MKNLPKPTDPGVILVVIKEWFEINTAGFSTKNGSLHWVGFITADFADDFDFTLTMVRMDIDFHVNRLADLLTLRGLVVIRHQK